MASQTLTGTQFADITGISDFSTKLHWIGSYTLLSQDPVANTSTLRLYGSIYLSNNSSQHYYSLGYNEKFTVAGTTLKTGRYDFYTPADNGYTLWGYTDRVVTHNSDGTFPSQTYTITACSGHFNYGNGQSASGTISGIASIDRTAATPTISVTSITANSFNLSVSASANCNKYEYSLDGGSTWTTFSTTDGTSASVSVTGLNPATTYALVVRVTKTYNEITSTASQNVSTLGYSVIDSISNINVGNTVTVSYHTQVANYYHKIQFTVGTTPRATETIGKITSVGNKTYTSTYNFPASILPDRESVVADVILYTYSNSSYTDLIGTSVGHFTLTVPDASPYLPTVSIAKTPYNTNTWINSKGLYVAGYTAFNITLTPTAGTGATVSSTSVTTPTSTSTGANTFRSEVIGRSGSVPITATVRDSRGRIGTTTVSETFLSYSAPSISSFSSQRGTYSGGTWTQSNTGNHIRIYLTASGSLSSQGNTVTKTVKATINGQQVNPNYTSGNYYYWTGTSADVSYLFTATATDSVGQSSTLTLTVASAEVPFNLNTTMPAAAFGKVAEQTKTVELANGWDLDVGGDVSVSGDVNVGGALDVSGAFGVTGTLSAGNLSLTNVSDVTHDLTTNVIFHATSSTPAATTAKVATVTGTFPSSLSVGTTVMITFSATNSGAVADLTLNVNGTGAKSIKYLNNSSTSNLSAVGQLQANRPIMFVYDGTYWLATGINYNNTYSSMSEAEAIAGTATTARSITAARLDKAIKSKFPYITEEKTETTTAYNNSTNTTVTWTCRKWSSGISECWTSYSFAQNGQSWAGGTEWTGLTLTYPANYFVSRPVIEVSTSSDPSTITRIWKTGDATETGAIGAYRPDTGMVGQSVTIYYSVRVTGRWE